MQDNDIKNFENNVLILIQELLSQWIPLFKEVGLSPKIGEIKVLNSSNIDYESEINIDFSDSYGICDVLEFYIYTENKPAASLEDFEIWLRENFNDVLARRKHLFEDAEE